MVIIYNEIDAIFTFVTEFMDWMYVCQCHILTLGLFPIHLSISKLLLNI